MKKVLLALLMTLFFTNLIWGEKTMIYEKPNNVITRWSSFENLNGVKGMGGMSNKTAKGHAFDSFEAGECKTLLNVSGSGMITRMWFTIDNRTTESLRSLRLDIYWDDAPTPAVSVPFGDFFNAMLEGPSAYENELFANPEGRSFNCYIPMPFHKSAKVNVTNDSKNKLNLLFYDIDYLLGVKHKKNVLYFHSIWRRENPTELKKDFEILPKIKGSGIFLGTNIAIILNKENLGWWGEGEVKMYIDGDTKYPTIVGTGTEDYIGTGWGQGRYSGRYQGCLVANEKSGYFTFYRYHVPDPVYFDNEIKVTIQQIGGDNKTNVIKMLKNGKPKIQPISLAWADKFVRLLDAAEPVDIEKHDSPPNSWCNYYRQDDVSAVAFFYLDKPENGLPGLAPLTERLAGLKKD